MFKEIGRTSQAVLVILCVLRTGKLGKVGVGAARFICFNFVKCKLT